MKNVIYLILAALLVANVATAQTKWPEFKAVTAVGTIKDQQQISNTPALNFYYKTGIGDEYAISLNSCQLTAWQEFFKTHPKYSLYDLVKLPNGATAIKLRAEDGDVCFCGAI